MSTHSSSLAMACWLLAVSSLPTTAAQIPPPVESSSKSPELRSRREAILNRERIKRKVVADPAESSRLDGSSRFLLLPEVVPGKPKGLANVEVARAVEVGRLDQQAARLEAATALFDLAIQAAKPPASFALADECLRGVIERQPDHAEARRLLGFVPYQGGWATPFAARMLAEGYEADATYGWVKADWVPHLRRGELPDRNLKLWLPADQANALRRDWANRWQISTEHFTISTNVPLIEAISFGRKLEDLHQLFFAMMADVIDPDRLPMAHRFKNPSAKATVATAKAAHQVCYFATRDEYARYLHPLQGEGSQVSLGTYVPRRESKAYGGLSYFFNDVDGQLEVSSTLYHEASHQLLFELAGPDDHARNLGQYWVFEGLGTYFETLKHEPDGSLRVGGLIGPRIAQAKARLVDGREFIPIEQFVGLNRPRFQADIGGGDIYLNYAESMALAVYLMQVDGGRHREAFLDYVRDVYKGRYRGGSGRSLEDQLGARYAELNRGVLAYLARAGKQP